MNKELRELYKRTLDEKWIPLLKEWKRSHEYIILYDKGISQKCPFCYDVIDRCDECKINPKICSNNSDTGYFATIDDFNLNMEKYLKKMIRLLKIEKFKCLYKKGG